VLLAPVMRANLKALAERASAHPSLARYSEAAALLTGDAQASAEDGAAWVQKLAQDLAIPGLSAYGIAASDLEDIAAKAAQASSMKGNPIELTQAELIAILEEAL
jgi:alcohol dehydrogenase class IV